MGTSGSSAVEKARATICEAIGAKKNELVFTSGGALSLPPCRRSVAFLSSCRFPNFPRCLF